ncbi:type I restriction enzyme HsdR N-terminal domain-containing protein [bacterium SCSIO 12827]|nr:type I restriction enzyme HsdR N-terminal domain-containing protein [bacterium SCSIO 12827]
MYCYVLIVIVLEGFMNLEGANETDVREEVAAPLLAALGYERGSSNDILRELTLKYGHSFLGRKKSNDPPLRGRADYVLAVLGAGRWVLEVKGPYEDITQDVIEQAISYARHPEVAGSYAAILNGRRFQLFHATQKSDDPPQLDIAVESVDQLARALRGVLSPADIRRDCTPPAVDLGLPLAEGFRSKAAVTGGNITHAFYEWESNFHLPNSGQMDETCRVLADMRSDITGGYVARDKESRIVGKLDWAYPNNAILQFAKDKQIENFEYISLDSDISTNPQAPTTFDVVAQITIDQGERLFDILRWESKEAGIATAMNLRGQAIGYIADDSFVGQFQTEYEMRFPLLPGAIVSMYGGGTFSVRLDPR